MNLREALLKEHSKENSLLIQKYVGDDQGRFSELLDLLFGDEAKISQRASMVVSTCFDFNPELFYFELERILIAFLNDELQLAVRRCIIRNLQFVEIPERFQAPLFNRCLLILHQADETVAVKAFSMLVGYNICRSFPELKLELEEAIRLILENSEKAGLQSRGKRILKKLDRL